MNDYQRHQRRMARRRRLLHEIDRQAGTGAKRHARNLKVFLGGEEKPVHVRIYFNRQCTDYKLIDQAAAT